MGKETLKTTKTPAASGPAKPKPEEKTVAQRQAEMNTSNVILSGALTRAGWTMDQKCTRREYEKMLADFLHNPPYRGGKK